MSLNKTSFRANKIFVDRINPTELVISTCKSLLNNKEKQIIVFYGFGGIGKTRLLTELCAKCNNIDQVKAIKIGLNTYEFNNIISILLAIRKKVNIDMPVFDYAVFQYYNKTGLPLDSVKAQFKDIKSSLISGMVKVAEECADIFVPYFSYVKKFFSLVPEIKNIYNHLKNKEIFQQIEQMEVNELLNFMPRILAEYINKSKNLYVIMFDDYESMRNKLDKCSVCDDCDEWIFSLFKNIEKGLFLFAAREKLNWDLKPVIASYTKQYLIDKLSGEDARTFLSSVPINDNALIENIIGIADGIPLYLDMCVDLYEDFISGNNKEFNLNDVDTSTIIERYLRHLSENQHNAVKYLAILDVFDIEFARYLLKKLNVSLDEIQLSNLLSKCLFEQIDEDNTYKLDTSIKNHMSALLSEEMMEKVAYALMDFIEISVSQNRLINLTRYYEMIIKIIGYTGITLEDVYKYQLIRCTNLMLDMGYWTSLDNIVRHNLCERDCSAYYQALISYIKCYYQKRTGDLNLAKQTAENLLLNKKWFGCYEYSIDLLFTQIIHLLGQYNVAMDRYSSIIGEMELFDLNTKDVRSYSLCKLKYADLLFLKGKFKTSLERLKEIVLPANCTPDLEVEYRRIKAHIYRFNFDFDTAAKLYEFALNNTAKDYKSKGALLNNLTEVNCFVNPTKAIEYGNQSLEFNKIIDSAVECGKTYAALGIAYSKIKSFEEAVKAIDEAFLIFDKVGYKSGKIFTLFSKLVYVIIKNKNRTKECKEIIEQMENIYKEIEVYKYLIIYVRILCGLNTGNEDGIEWLDRDKTFLALKELAK